MRKTILTLAATLCAALATGTSATAQTVSVSNIATEWSRDIQYYDLEVGGKTSGTVSMKVDVDVPTAAVSTLSPALYRSILTWMVKETTLPLVSASKDKNSLTQTLRERCNIKVRPYEEVVRISKIYEDAYYVSFSIWHYQMSYGNAHGLTTDAGVTFRKSDGQRLTWDNIRKTDALRKAVTRNLRQDDEGVEVSVSVSTYDMEDYSECRLSDGTYALPLPETAPYLTRRGWRFTYQPYETILYGMYSMWSYVSNVSLTN